VRVAVVLICLLGSLDDVLALALSSRAVLAQIYLFFEFIQSYCRAGFFRCRAGVNMAELPLFRPPPGLWEPVRAAPSPRTLARRKRRAAVRSAHVPGCAREDKDFMVLVGSLSGDIKLLKAELESLRELSVSPSLGAESKLELKEMKKLKISLDEQELGPRSCGTRCVSGPLCARLSRSLLIRLVQTSRPKGGERSKEIEKIRGLFLELEDTLAVKDAEIAVGSLISKWILLG